MTISESLQSQPPSYLRVYIVRHGQTHQNILGTIQGRLDTALNAFGHLQAETTADYFSDIRFDRIITSPLQRARDTAQIILSKQPSDAKVPLEQDDRIQERGFGALEGKPYGGPKNELDVEGMELVADAKERLTSFWNDLITLPASAGIQEQEEQAILLVSHGAAIKLLLNDILLAGKHIHIPSEIQIHTERGNCSITELIVPMVLDHRTLSHLERPGALDLKHEWAVKVPQAETGKSNKPESSEQLRAQGQVVLQDLGYGPGVGHAARWWDVMHLQGLATEATGGVVQGKGKPSEVNVDELVAK